VSLFSANTAISEMTIPVKVGRTVLVSEERRDFFCGKNVEACFLAVLGPMVWVYRQMSQGADPRAVLRALVPQETDLPDELDNLTLWKIILSLLSEPPRRKRLQDVTQLDHVLRLLKESQKILVLTGAGVCT